MPLMRIDYVGILKVVSPLHIGNGQFKEEDENSNCAEIQRTPNGAPFIPATSLKGVLRGLCENELEELFGQIGHDSNMGAALVRAAFLDSDMDAVKTTQRDQQDGCFVLQRTRIDAGRGTSFSSGLFAEEMVAKNVTFSLRIRLEARCDEKDFSVLATSLEKTLQKLANLDGVEFGANGSSGFGRVSLCELFSTPWSQGDFGALVAGTKKEVVLQKGEHTFEFEQSFISEAPFIIQDETKDNTVIALRSGEKPFVTGTSLKGVMRSRAQWLNNLGLLRNQPDRNQAIDELFGTTAAKGKLLIVIDHEEGVPHKQASIKIDRFSGAPMHNALFIVDADESTSFRLRLDTINASKEAKDMLDTLLADIKEHGIDLGSGEARGQGWFCVKEAANG